MLSLKNALHSDPPNACLPLYGDIRTMVRYFLHTTEKNIQGNINLKKFFCTPTIKVQKSFIGACLARCSQPEVGWLGWRSTNDENLVKAILDSCLFDRASGSNKKIFKSNSTKLPSESESNSSHPSSSLSTLSNEKVRLLNFGIIFENRDFQNRNLSYDYNTFCINCFRTTFQMEM